MDGHQQRYAINGRVRVVLGFAVAAIASDALIAAVAWADWNAFRAAPNNAFLVPEDDLSFALAGFAFTASSLLRYLVLVGLVVALVSCRASGPQEPNWAPIAGRVRLVLAVGVVLVEVLYVAAVWTRTQPDGTWCVIRVVSSAISAVLAALVLRLSLGSVTRTNGARVMTT